MINAFSQLGNVAGSYVWDLEDNGYRQSYGIVTAMFGVTIVGAFLFRGMLGRLNKQLEIQDSQSDDGSAPATPPADESLRMQKGFRYLT